MNIEEFVAETINEVEKGVNRASEENGKKYFIDNINSKGIHFDLAVTFIEKELSEKEGSIGAAIAV